MTVEFMHEVAGKRESATVKISRKMGDKKAYTRDAFEGHICGILECASIVGPQIVKISYDAEPMLDFECEEYATDKKKKAGL
jgi:hypothetical protein